MAEQAIQIAPRDEREIEQAHSLYRMLVHEPTAALVAPDGSRIDLPPAVHEVLMRVVEKMQEGHAVAVMPMMQELTTQAAADMVGVSRQFFVRECEAGKIPFHFTGTHRRVLLKDLLEYRKRRSEARKKAIVAIARRSEELAAFDKFVPPEE
jgi:excisionase family DNA binding protein